jgi:hypothetical protein
MVRNKVELGEIIGEGKFGEVNKGKLKGREKKMVKVDVKK